ncbi:MAG: NAD-dependent DNA ligase LigA [Planctomycetes bacterium]|nr:NAD-dependent DNA ligase LigA [Planctomycetota bacterium]
MSKRRGPQSESTEQATVRMHELAALLRHHDDLYYNEAEPEITDAEYDALRREFEELEREHPEVELPESPSRRVGAEVRDRAAQKAEHRVPMLSLDSLTSAEEVREFAIRARKGLDIEEGGESDLVWSLEPKYDGVSANLLYEDGVFVLGLSRGDGRIGEVSTANYARVKGVLPKLRGTKLPKRIEVRGEILLSRSRFRELQQEQEKSDQQVFRNARNAVAGALKRVDPTGLEDFGMEFIAWGVGAYDGGNDTATYFELLDRLTEFGFTKTDLLEEARGTEAILEYHDRLEAARDEYRFEMDGIVAKLADMAQQRMLGRTARAPKWALAYKFAPRQAWTHVEDILVQVGRTGAITPVAVLEAVDLAGVTVRRASLHNFGLLHERDVRPLDRVLVERAGDVIPEVVRVDLEARPENSVPFAAPSQCPECREPVHGEGPVLYCSNIDCPAQIRERVIHLAGRRALDIDRLGEKYVDQLFAAGLLKSVEDVFELDQHREELLELERWGAKSVQSLLEEIERAKEPELSRFLYALGIRHVGEKTSQDLASHFGSFSSIRDADREALLEVEGIGDVVATEIGAFFASDRNRAFLERLDVAGVRVRDAERKQIAEDAPLAGRTFVFTGGLESMTRDEAREHVEALGAKTVTGVSAKVTDVVVGAGSGSKRAKAEKLGLTILEEDAFLQLLEAMKS